MGLHGHRDRPGMLCTYWHHQISNEYGLEYSLGAPALNDASEHHLLWIISNKCEEVENDTSEVAIWTPANHGLCHAWM